MKLMNFWVVTEPTSISEKGDILFQSNFHDMRLQFLGGLDSSDIHGVYTEKAEAEKVVDDLLKEQDAQ